MRILFKLLMKLAMFAAILMLSAGGLRHGAGLFTGKSGGAGNLIADGGQVTDAESDLTGTVFKSALKLVSGQASRSELSNELNGKLYGQRGDPSDMAELGIELVTPKGGAPVPLGGGNAAGSPSAGKPGDKLDPKLAAKPGQNPAAAQKAAVPGTSGAPSAAKLPAGAELVSGKGVAALSEIWQRLKQYTVELSLVPVVFVGMVFVGRVRRRKNERGLAIDFVAALPESDAEKYAMKHQVQSLTAEEFELLVALIYQRQGYRVSMPAALNSGRSSQFKLARKSERLLVQCHNFKHFHKVEVHLVRELHDAMVDANVTGGLFVASCRYTWDARHFAKTRNIKLITAKTLDLLLTKACATPEEKLLEITPWLPKFMTKVEMATPHCPECGAEMDEAKAGDGSAWLCNQRPECGGRRDVRKYRKGLHVAAPDDGTGAGTAVASEPERESVASVQCEAVEKNQKLLQTKQVAQQSGKAPKACSTPSATPGVQRDCASETQVATANQMPGPKQQPASLPGTMPTKQTLATESAKVEAVVRDVIPGRTRTPALVKQGIPPSNTQPGSSQPVPTAVEGKPAEKNADAGGAAPAASSQGQVPAPQPPMPDPECVPARGPGAKRNGGLLSNVAEDFRRRGFRLEQKPLTKPKPAPGPARGAGSTPQASQKRGSHRLEEEKPKSKAP